jgi:hypothetical protein
MEMNRRDITLSGAAMTAATLTGQGLAEAAPAAMPRTKFDPNAWHQRIKRIMQVNFDERDAEALDIEKYADYLSSIKAQATYLSITNQTAFYPTKIPDLIASRWLNGRDFFGECVKALRARNIRILGRLSIDLAPTAMVEKHPDWFLRNKDGSIPDRDGFPGFSPRFKPTCQFTSYYSEFIPKVIEEVVTRYDIDAVYSNGWPGTNATICYCQACQKIGDPTTRAYKEAYLKRAKELWGLYDSIVARHKPNMFFTGNLGGGFSGGDLDLKDLTEYAAWFVADNQGRAGYGAPAWDAAQQGRIAKAIMTERLVPNATGSYAICGEARWRGSVTGNPIEVRSRLYQTLATGTTMFVTWINGTAGFKEDRRWQDVIRPVFLFQAANDKHFHTKRSIASVALLVGQRSNRLYKEPPGTSGLDSINGMYQILTEARIPFDVILETDLVPERLSRYSVLVLSNIALMSDEQALKIEAFAAKGGSVLATFETGTYDENGTSRADFALAKLFNMKLAGRRLGYGSVDSRGRHPGQVSFQRIEKPHAIVENFKNTNWIKGSSWIVPITADGPPILTYIPQFPWYPVEATFPDPDHTDIKSVVARDNGASKLVYLAEDIEATYWRTGGDDLGDLVTNALRWMIGDNTPLNVEGDGLVETYGWETEVGYAVHLINYTNPNFRTTGSRHMYAVGDQKVRLTLPDLKPIKTATLLHSGQPLTFEQRGNVVEFTIPNLVDYEAAGLEI